MGGRRPMEGSLVQHFISSATTDIGQFAAQAGGPDSVRRRKFALEGILLAVQGPLEVTIPTGYPCDLYFNIRKEDGYFDLQSGGQTWTTPGLPSNNYAACPSTSCNDSALTGATCFGNSGFHVFANQSLPVGSRASIVYRKSSS